MDDTTHLRTIVVGVDGSAGASRAIRWAATEAAATSSRLRLVNAWDVPDVFSPGMPGPYIQADEIAQGAHRILERAEHEARRDLAGRPVPIDTLAVRARPADGLLGACDHADLLVVGTRGRGGFASLLLGSVAHTCAHRTPIPLVVVGHEVPGPGSGPIVVGADGSDGGRAAVGWAVAEASRLGCSLRVVHAWDLPGRAIDGPPPFLVPDIDPATVRGLRDRYREEAARAAAELGATVPTEVVISCPGPAESLVAASSTASLVVVGSRGRGGLAGLLLGSVGQQVLHHSACPVVVVPHARHR